MSGVLIELEGKAQQYPWGKLGRSSVVATLLAAGNENFKIDETQPYAELWMGTHPKSPLVVKDTGELLSDYIGKHKEKVVGSAVAQEVGNNLPYLFKVLSVDKALSIQAHPNKTLAKILHAKDPKNYPDGNHKPEMAIAITDFGGLCGFRPLSEIVYFIETVGEFKKLLSNDSIMKLKNAKTIEEERVALKQSYGEVMRTNEETISRSVKSLMAQVDGTGSLISDSNNFHIPDNSVFMEELMLKVEREFPGDVGIFNMFFLNIVQLKPGDAIFLGANIPHAYIYGNCMEVMSCSDNVVRAGFTPKFKDVEVLCEMLIFESIKGEKMFQSIQVNDHVSLYDPPIDEFSMLRGVGKFGSKFSLPAKNGPSILICIDGKGTALNNNLAIGKGSIIFVPINTEVPLLSQSDDFTVYSAFCDLNC